MWHKCTQKLQKWLMPDARSFKCLGISILFHSVLALSWTLFMVPAQGTPDVELLDVGFVAGSTPGQASDEQLLEEEDTPQDFSQLSDKLAQELTESVATDDSEVQNYLVEQKQQVAAKKQRMAQFKNQQNTIKGRLAERSKYGTLAPRTFYGIRVFERRMVFVLDISGSMDLGEARIQLQNAYHALNAAESFNIIAYHDAVFAWKSELMPATAANKQDADAWILRLPGGGATDIFGAMQTAFTKAWSGDKAETMYIVTDGLPTAGAVQNPVQILTAVRQWNADKNIMLHTIGIGPQQDKSFLESLAGQNRGRYFVR
jgi:hypothetical protein